MKQKLEVITLDLGLDVEEETKKQEINPAMRQKIQEVLDMAKEEHQNIKTIQNEKEKLIEKCYHTLVDATNAGSEIDSKILLVLAETTNISGLIIRLKNLIKKRGNLWILTKRKMDGKILYSLKPS